MITDITGVDFMATTKGLKRSYKYLLRPQIIPKTMPPKHDMAKPATTLIKVMAILYQNFVFNDKPKKAFAVLNGEGR